ncbi:hypothetical protein ES332_A06G184900v1 [Gossypium tomentosum]|uniref:Uncharacterized protein n=1 Tax=Gossypium tomentosum TaxID=34277 RepID=A0A5D2Q607_GOSTO|nr:hypothetical protein ES332_A06G184900v1 [Gossypium tomentosum]
MKRSRGEDESDIFFEQRVAFFETVSNIVNRPSKRSLSQRLGGGCIDGERDGATGRNGREDGETIFRDGKRLIS